MNLLDRMSNRGYSSSSGYGPQNPYMRPNYNSGGYDQDRYYGQGGGGGRPYGQGQGQRPDRPDQPEYYDRPSAGGGSSGSGGSGYRGGSGGSSGGYGSPPQDDYSFRPVDQTYRYDFQF